MELVIKLKHKHSDSLQTQIATQIRKLIIEDTLHRQVRLPSTRELSEQLGVSRNTVKGAYDILLDEAYIESRRSSGTYVCATLPEQALAIKQAASVNRKLKNDLPVHLNKTAHSREKKLYQLEQSELEYDFQLERTDPESFPLKSWQRIINSKMSEAPTKMTRYGEATGLAELRRAIAARIAVSRGIIVKPEQIIMTTGIQQGLNVVSHLFVRTGSRVVIEAPGYRGASYLFQNYGAELIPVAVDAEGVITDALPARKCDLAFITPSRQFPMGGSLPMERRLALLEWAADSGAYIVEVDYDSDFRYEGTPDAAIKALDELESVIHLSSFSKSIGPGLRLGYMILPPALVESAKSSRLLLDYGLPWLDQVVLAEFIASGSFDNYLKRLRRLYKSRRDRIITMLGNAHSDLQLSGLECGTHLVWKLPVGSIPAAELQRRARQQSTGIYTLSHQSICLPEFEAEHLRYVLLGYGALPEKAISAGIQILSAILAHPS